eukprot:793961-Pleurochrysis_carterae.AAC.3
MDRFDPRETWRSQLNRWGVHGHTRLPCPARLLASPAVGAVLPDGRCTQASTASAIKSNMHQETQNGTKRAQQQCATAQPPIQRIPRSPSLRLTPVD